MKFALLGADEEAIAVAEAITRSETHELVAACDVAQTLEAIRRLAPKAGVDEAWESLLHGTVADAVIACAGSDGELRAQQLRRLVQASIPLIVVHPVCEMIVAFELQMIQRDTGCVIVPHFPGIHHLAIRRMADWSISSDSPLGAVQQLTIQRRMSDSSKRSVDNQFARDALFIGQFVGPIQSISALATARETDGVSNYNVQMSSESGVVAHWSALPGVHAQSGALTLYGDGGYAVLSMLGDPADWQLKLNDRDFEIGDVSTGDSERVAVEQLAQAMAGRPITPSWCDACRALEIVDAVEVSGRRGKTVDLHHEVLSEESTFKSLMAAGGCLTLLLVLLLLPALAMVDSLSRSWRQPSDSSAGRPGVASDDRSPTTGAQSPFLREKTAPRTGRGWFSLRSWPYALLGVLACFLGLQLLRLVFASDGDDSEANRT